MEYRTRQEMYEAHKARRRRMAEAAERYRLSKLPPPPPPKVEIPQSPLLPDVKVLTNPKPISEKEIDQILSKYRLVATIGISDYPYRSQTIKEFVKDVCRRHRLSEEELWSRSRKTRPKEARWELWYLIRKNLQLSLPHIGQRCGGYDHTTVMHGIRRWEEILAKNALLDNKPLADQQTGELV